MGDSMKNRYLVAGLTIFLLVTSNNIFAGSNEAVGNSNDQLEDDHTTEEDTGLPEDDGISDIEIYVNVAARRLFLYDGNELVKVYPVATGMAIYPTPIGGMYPVLLGISNPDWTPPNSPWAAGSHYEPPGPKSATGIAKLYLRSPGVHIHGTPKDNSIGTFASHGCIRMHNTDVVELLEYVLENVDHTKPGRFKDVSNEEYFAWVSEHPNTKFVAQMNEVIYVHTYYKRVEILDGQLMISKDGYHRGGDIEQMIEDELIEQRYNFSDLDWKIFESLNSKEDYVFDLKELGVTRSKNFSQAQGIHNREDL
jgi:hypothetical protein